MKGQETTASDDMEGWENTEMLAVETEMHEGLKNTQSEETLEEWHALRAEQDRAQEMSLQADREKVRVLFF